jgi:hypothetical protein
LPDALLPPDGCDDEPGCGPPDTFVCGVPADFIRALVQYAYVCAGVIVELLAAGELLFADFDL